MYAIYGNIYHQYTPNVSIYTIHGSYGIVIVPWSSTVSGLPPPARPPPPAAGASAAACVDRLHAVSAAGCCHRGAIGGKGPQKSRKNHGEMMGKWWENVGWSWFIHVSMFIPEKCELIMVDPVVFFWTWCRRDRPQESLHIANLGTLGPHFVGTKLSMGELMMTTSSGMILCTLWSLCQLENHHFLRNQRTT